MTQNLEYILIVDDEDTIRYAAKNALSSPGRKVFEAANGNDALAVFKQQPIHVAIFDIKMPGMSGLELLQKVKANWPDTIVIMISAYGDMSRITEAMKLGAYDFLSKPFSHINDLISLVDKAFTAHRLLKNPVAETVEIMPREKSFSIIGKSHKMQDIYKLIGKISGSNVTVLVTGESGSGKELIAKAIHSNSPRADKAFLAVNCTAIPSTLIESEFFGHEKGAFTGAVSTKIGKFELANTGTLFLDEIGDMTPDIQAKLLRVLQEKEIVRVGGNKTISVDVRIIAATNRDLEKSIVDGSFREDLYHRLKVVTIHVPPLRERKEDIEDLVSYFVKTLNAELGRNVTSVSDAAMNILKKYNWPGNIRELRNCIESAMAIHNETQILPEHLTREVRDKVREIEKESQFEPTAEPLAINVCEHGAATFEEALESYVKAMLEKSTAEHFEGGLYAEVIGVVEKVLIRETLTAVEGNQVKASKLLEINRNTLRSKVEKYGI